MQNNVTTTCQQIRNGPILTQTMTYCLYARKSTESDEKQALSIDSQIKEMTELAIRENLNVIDVRRESHSAKNSGERPVYNQLIKDVENGIFNSILTWAPDRLSRNAGDLGSLVDLMDQKKLYEIRTFSQKFTDNPNEKFLLMILGSQAKLENDNKSINVKRGLRASVEKGLWPGPAPTGYLNERRTDRKGYVMVDPKRGPLIKQIYERVANEHFSGRDIYHWLKEIDFRSINDKHFSLSNIYRLLKNPFYYGEFEYPVGSGNWYKGRHTPLISKNIYNKVQEWLERGNLQGRQSKEFAFTNLMKCGLCGSGISAQEKIKRRLDGKETRYVYYSCTKGKDIDCKSGYLEEGKLIEQIEAIIDKVDLDMLGIKQKIDLELNRYTKFRVGLLGLTPDEAKKQASIDHKAYAKYILREGSIYEKREILESLKSKLIMKDKIIKVINS
jgi:site-specific DNA recombinase